MAASLLKSSATALAGSRRQGNPSAALPGPPCPWYWHTQDGWGGRRTGPLGDFPASPVFPAMTPLQLAGYGSILQKGKQRHGAGAALACGLPGSQWQGQGQIPSPESQPRARPLVWAGAATWCLAWHLGSLGGNSPQPPRPCHLSGAAGPKGFPRLQALVPRVGEHQGAQSSRDPAPWI